MGNAHPTLTLVLTPQIEDEIAFILDRRKIKEDEIVKLFRAKVVQHCTGLLSILSIFYRHQLKN